MYHLAQLEITAGMNGVETSWMNPLRQLDNKQRINHQSADESLVLESTTIK